VIHCEIDETLPLQLMLLVSNVFSLCVEVVLTPGVNDSLGAVIQWAEFPCDDDHGHSHSHGSSHGHSHSGGHGHSHGDQECDGSH